MRRNVITTPKDSPQLAYYLFYTRSFVHSRILVIYPRQPETKNSLFTMELTRMNPC
ncbi:unnamed protein product [Strongylus vulgaris]|uniref:Uncharacterized protein n=1 Tax=Strongylus vulgaris TaxID=40348 RepID=A0A3P7JU60_STRVU|nr:unnamed protein product [Strongylus vulgaris]